MSENNRELAAIATKHANNRLEIYHCSNVIVSICSDKKAASTFQEKCRSNNLRVMKAGTARNLRETMRSHNGDELFEANFFIP